MLDFGTTEACCRKFLWILGEVVVFSRGVRAIANHLNDIVIYLSIIISRLTVSIKFATKTSLLRNVKDLCLLDSEARCANDLISIYLNSKANL